MNLTVILPSPRIGDFVWTWYSDCLITDRVLKLFQGAGFTGFEPRPVAVEKVQGVRKGTEFAIPTLWELTVAGLAGDADPASGIKVIEVCYGCHMTTYSSFRNGIIVSKDNWDGSDFFVINGYPKCILVSERVKELIIYERLVNCALVVSTELQWNSGPRPEEVLELSRQLNTLLESLPRSVNCNSISEDQRLGERISIAESIGNTTILREGGGLLWTPVNEPPAELERLAWAWVIRPDLSSMIASRSDILRPAIVRSWGPSDQK
jgi:hypothetical protein